jgi:hypothetical protein
MPPSLSTAKRWLSLLWLSGFAVAFLILLVRSLSTSGPSQTSEMWSWFLPTTLPTVSLIVGVLVADWRRQPVLNKPADGALFALALSVSVLYLLAVIATLVRSGLGDSPIDFLKGSHVYLGPVQGLATGALAAFFRR